MYLFNIEIDRDGQDFPVYLDFIAKLFADQRPRLVTEILFIHKIRLILSAGGSDMLILM